ncbi:hypothetical protein BD289DRAFT_215393 [Coniella lustricola]|uniref:C2H2-type domain-containing protein n=1 Tax=Coniella lustricola TaxID=2025994 RepID=A0A2T3ABK0_9PEZI|nr:hypothetical protein BD289DRAFT_215393 [Coniella lustricola]
MDDFFLPYVAPGHSTNHKHKGYAHDEGCVPAKHIEPDWLDFAQIYGAGTAPIAHYHGEYASHDTSCLDGSGCPRLGLDPFVNDKGSIAMGTSPLGNFDLMAQSSMLFQPFSASLADFDPAIASHVQTPNPTLLDAVSLSPPSRVSQRPNDQLHHIAECDAESEADSQGSCDSHCLGSVGACSAGTCDEATACRDENCQKPGVEPDVAHSAFILQGISGARQQQSSEQQLHRNSFQPEFVDPNTNYVTSGQVQPFDQAYQFPFHYQSGFASVQPQAMPDASPRDIHGNFMDNSAFSTNFTQDVSSSMTDPQTPYPSALASSQTIAINQALGSNNQIFAWQPLYNSQNDFATAAEQVCGQQAVLDNGSHVMSADIAASSPTQWLRSTTHGFPFDNSLGEEISNINQTTTIPNKVSIGTQESNNTQDDCFTPLTSNSHSSPAKSFDGIARTSSPVSEFSMKDTSATSIESMSQGIEAHMCRWQLNGGQICGKHFDSHSLLHDHVDDAHFNNLKITGDHGLICQWADCDRLTNDKYNEKRGFDTKSKLRRHMEIHTGPVEVHDCGICGKSFPSKHALKMHLRTHSDERPYKCNICGDGFKRAYDITMHMRSAHSEEKPFECPICHKKFKDSSNFSKHKRTHEQRKRWVCQDCCKPFCRRDGLIRHAISNHALAKDALERLSLRGARARVGSIS